MVRALSPSSLHPRIPTSPLGVGIDLSLDQEPYYFIGTRLFELAKGLGIKKQPGAPDEN